MLRVLYLINFAGKAGTERYVETLIKKLKTDRIEPFLVYNIDGPLVEVAKELGAKTFQITMKSPFDKKAAKELAAICKAEKIDVVHAQFLRENYIALFAKRKYPGIKVVYTMHFVMHNNPIIKFFNRRLAKNNHAMISVCNLGAKVLAENGNPAEKICVINNGVDIKEWATKTGATLKTELQLQGETQLMLCSARFAHDKGHKYLIDSIAVLKEQTKVPICLALANDGPLFEEIKAYAEEKNLTDIVRFLGFRKDVKNLLDSCDIYVNSSEHEALSFNLVEACAAEKPIIATDMAGNSDIVNNKTNCGLLVEYNNPKSMADAMKLLLEDVNLRNVYAKNARLAAEKYFNLDTVASETYKIYLEGVNK